MSLTIDVLKTADQDSLKRSRDGLNLALECPVDGHTQQITLSWFQRQCLLAYYTFHQYPGRQSWSRVGALTRMAYAAGLNRLDHPRGYSTFQVMNETDDIDAWRRVWWVIYCMDSYTNVAAATPFLVEYDSTRTALRQYPAANTNLIGDKLFLANELSHLWMTVEEIAGRKPLDHFAIHLVTTSLLKEACNIHRLALMNPYVDLSARRASLDDTVALVSLALPPGYNDVRRQILQGESIEDFHMRLVNCIHLAMITAAALFSATTSVPPSASTPSWQTLLECSLTIANIIAHWDSNMLAATDPAICLIVFALLTMLKLYVRFHTDDIPDIKARAQQCETKLSLFLKHFSAFWQLPIYLLGIQRKVGLVLEGCATYEDARKTLQGQECDGMMNLDAIRKLIPVRHTPQAMGTDIDLSWLDDIDFSDMPLLESVPGENIINLHT
ncbi:hypothetical protein BAUCODRAFT_123982 [Baudoinia panamericana UAMH 10762]|uniref:Xylanolytic transcriptional activator regulatory domain-containing protein n=1 Tax=Baudoinia panamericana (strain UAMH 10762) TaxID=717646 RepID=M2LJD0_BAUPA|nr:uncharacterized protein BAUCODRAFT_123982 [Baudoinia panamericana UAMH 10762]EMC94342.1 hypothetical protein BAUCODRAFT_123982 [Baudoinia panamericana UAMH 10762]